MWVLYSVASSKAPLSQQDLHARMMFPKQTINSAVARLSAEGAVRLEAMPAGRGRKAVALTPAGRDLCQKTVLAMRGAECDAVERLGPGRMAVFAGLYAEFLHAVEEGLRRRGLAD